MKKISATVKVTSCNIQKIKYIFAPNPGKKFPPQHLHHVSYNIHQYQ